MIKIVKNNENEKQQKLAKSPKYQRVSVPWFRRGRSFFKFCYKGLYKWLLIVNYPNSVNHHPLCHVIFSFYHIYQFIKRLKFQNLEFTPAAAAFNIKTKQKKPTF